MYITVELRDTEIRQHQITGQNWGTGRPPSKIKGGIMIVDSDKKVTERNEKVV